MSKHTPGPWEWDGGGFVFGPDDSRLRRCPYVAQIRDGGLSEDTLDANARLIAASPDMLAALNGLVGLIEAGGIYNLAKGVQLGQTAWFVKATDAVKHANDAIAKAEGGEL